MTNERGQRGPGVAFLLSQLGAVATERFTQALTDLGLSPGQAGVLRQLAGADPLSQQDLARRLGTAPSRIVSYLDGLQEQGAIRRTPGPDRRVNLVSLTPEGEELLRRVGNVARQHEADLTASLSATRRRELLAHLSELAAALEVRDGVHPGFRAPSAARHRD